MSDIVWTSDLQFTMSFISPSVERVIGESIDDHIKRPIYEKFTPDSVKKIISLFNKELAYESSPDCDKNRTLKVEVEHYRTV